MGKRSSAKKPQTRIKVVLDKTFRCLFCQHQATVTCKLDSKNKVGRLDCKNCGQSFSADINHLTEPVDIYAEWIDAVLETNTRADAEIGPAPPRKRAAPAAEARRDDADEDEDEEDLPDLRAKKAKRADPVREEEEEEEEDLPLEIPRRKHAVDESDEE